MAIAFVNGARLGNPASASSIVTASASLTAGNFFAIAYYVDDVSVTPSGVPTDTAGNTYIQAGTTQAIGGGGGNIAIYYVFNCLGSAVNVVTLNLSGATADRAYADWQFSGVPITNPKIGTVFGSGASGLTLTASSALSHGSGSCVMLALGVGFGAGGTSITAGGSGYTFTAFNFTGSADNNLGDEYQILSADNTPSMTADFSLSAWGIMGASFGTPVTSASGHRLALLGAGN